MKLLLLSDSHGSVENMKKAVAIESPDMIFFMGDGQRDIRELMREHPQIPCHAVCGNCDYGSDFPQELLVTVNGVRILLCHGHCYGVKRSYDRLFRRGYMKRAKLLLSGHTHQAVIREKLGITLINPGSIGFYYEPTYAVAEVEQGVVTRREIRPLMSPVFEL